MINKFFNKEIYGGFLFLFLISSINSPPSLPSEFNILNFINFLRGISPIIVFIFLLFFFFKKKFSLSKNSIFFLIFISSQLVGYFINEDRNFFNIYWIICAYALVFLIEFYSDNIKSIKLLLFIFLFFIISVALVVSYAIILEETNKFISDINYISTIYSSQVLAENTSFLGQSVPRSSGYCRMLLIIFFLLFSLLLIQNDYDSKKIKVILKKIIFYILLIFIGLILWKTQNRGTLYFYLIIFLFYLGHTIYSFKKENLIRIFLIFFTPFILFSAEVKLKEHLISEAVKTILEKNLIEENLYKKNLIEENLYKKNLSEKQLKKLDEFDKSQIKILKNNNKRWTMPNETSGRMEIWKKSIPFIKKNLFFGQGPQSDRNLLSKNASNILVYILLCGGVFCTLFFFIYLFNLLIQYSRFILKFNIKNFNKDHILIFTNLCIFFLLFRGLVENSFSIFGIDMILFLLSVKYIEIFIDSQNKHHRRD